MSFGYLPWQRLRTDAERPCVQDDSVQPTYGEFDARIAAFACQLAELGFGRGDVLAVMLPNRVELLVALLAAWRLGGAATPINPVFTASETDYQIADSGAAVVVNQGPGAPTGGRPTIGVDTCARFPGRARRLPSS